VKQTNVSYIVPVISNSIIFIVNIAGTVIGAVVMQSTGLRHEYETLCHQDYGMSPVFRLNAFHYLDKEEMKLKRTLGELGGECNAPTANWSAVQKVGTREQLTHFKAYWISFTPCDSTLLYALLSTRAVRSTRHAHPQGSLLRFPGKAGGCQKECLWVSSL
jgi:hypothetical protein